VTDAGGRPQPEPIAELRDLEEQPTPGFFHRVRRSVERRQLAADTVDLSWTVVQVMVLEALGVIFQIFGRSRDDKGGNR
jgi:hypothetical protein